MGLTCRKWLGDEFICVCALALIWAPGAHATRVGDMLLENDGAYGYGDIDALGATETTIPAVCSGECADTYSKCAGKDIDTQLRCCNGDDQCVFKNSFYSQCRPKTKGIPAEWIDGKALEDCVSTDASPPDSSPPETESPVETIEPIDFQQSIGLTLSPRDVYVGEDVLITFTVKLQESIDAASPPIVLFEGAAGTTEDMVIGQALDDGSPTTMDDVADDGIYTNALSFNFDSAGVVSFRAIIGDSVYIDTITVRERSNIEESSLFESYWETMNDLLLGRSSEEAMLLLYESIIQQLPDGIASADDVVLTTGDFPSVSWTTTEGLVEALVPHFPSASPQDEPYLWENLLGEVGSTGLSISGNTLTQEDGAADPDRRLQDSSSVGQYDCVTGVAMSFFGFGNVNFLAEAAQNAEVPDGQVQVVHSLGSSLEDLKKLNRFSAISIATLSRLISYAASTGTISSFRALITDATLASAGSSYRADILAKRVVSVNGYLAVMPNFFKRYLAPLNGAAVYIGASDSAGVGGFTGAFSGAGTVFGHSGVWTPQDVWTSLFNGYSAGVVPCVVSGECTATDPAYDVVDICRETDVPALRVSYTWPANAPDLDTGTEFLGAQVGYSCGSGQYMLFSGDDTTAGGQESVEIDLNAALAAVEWEQTDGVVVNLRAGWYTPAGGSGPASVTATFVDGSSSIPVTTILPGSQNGCASKCVGSVVIRTLPRPSLEFVTGSSCQGVAPEQEPPVPMTGPNECLQNLYSNLQYDPNGNGELLTSFLNPIDLFGTIFSLSREAKNAALDQYPWARPPTETPCWNNVCDAFRHAYFNFRLTSELGSASAAKEWADAHEVSGGNPTPELLMDLTNNAVGRQLAVDNPGGNATVIVLDAISQGLVALEPIETCGSS